MNFIRKNRENITRDNNVIRINKLDHPLCVNEFLYCLFDGAERGYKDFRIFYQMGFDNKYPYHSNILQYQSHRYVDSL